MKYRMHFEIVVIVILACSAQLACNAIRSAAAPAAEATFLSQHLACVEKFKPVKAAIDDCRAAVDAKWGVSK